MSTNKHLKFILDKISHLNIARFYCQSTSVLTIPNTVVQTYSVHDTGHILFFLPRPKQLVSQFEKEFLVVVHYFKKGINYYVDIEGFARIIDDSEELHCYDLSPEQMNKALTSDVLVKVKILKADYFEKLPTRKSIFTKIISYICNILANVNKADKTFDFRRKPEQIHNFGLKNISVRNPFPRFQFFQW